jgi:hypothetical protein
MSQTRQDAEWRALTGATYVELGHRDTIDWHYHDVQQIVYPSSGVLAISADATADPPLPADPAVLAVSPLLREVIVALSSGDGTPYTDTRGVGGIRETLPR